MNVIRSQYGNMHLNGNQFIRSSGSFSKSYNLISGNKSSITFFLETDEDLKRLEEHLSCWLREDEAVSRVNDEIQANNFAVVESFVKEIHASGLPRRVYDLAPRSRTRKEWQAAPWVVALVSALPNRNPYLHTVGKDRVARLMEEARKIIVEKKEQKRAHEARIISSEVTERAVEFLLARGKKLGADFSLLTAVQVADSLVFEEKLEAMKGTEVDHSSCSECSTWTVGEPRCACGNRRMYMDSSGNFLNMLLFPNAD